MMVQLKVFALLVLCFSYETSSQLLSENKRKVVLQLKSSETNSFYENDLHLIPTQKKMMYESTRLQKKEAFFDLFKWPKNYEGFVIVPYWISRNSHFCE
jgi:hypothetical protein